jgi:hypothetical protein
MQQGGICSTECQRSLFSPASNTLELARGVDSRHLNSCRGRRFIDSLQPGNIYKHSQAQKHFPMADMGLRYDMEVAAKGEEQGNVEILKDLHDPGRQGTEVSGKADSRVSQT